MADKLYAVTAGAYSDYHIVSLCSDRARAEQICDMYGGRGFGRAVVEEFSDGVRTDIFKPLFEISLKEDGELGEASECTGSTKMETLLNPEGGYRLGIIEQWDGGYLTFVSADNADSAIKIARDRLAQYKAEKEGI